MSSASRKSRALDYCFLGAGIPEDFGTDNDGPFRKSIVGASTVEKSHYGIELGVTAGTAVEMAEINQNNILALNVDEIIAVEFDARIDIDAGTDTSGLEFMFGLIGARDDDADAIEPAIMVRIVDDSVYLESNDGAGRDVDAIDSEFDLNPGYWQRYSIDLATGVQTHGAPMQSAGGKARPLFHVSGNGISKRALNSVHTNQSFDISAYTGGLQLFARAAKHDAASTNAATLSIRNICAEIRW